MYKTERQRELMNILKEEKNGGFVSIHRLARQMFASEATIRRDLRELEAQNAIKRAYGGVALMEYLNQNIPLPLREQTHHPEKVEAARRAASVVRDGDVLFLDGASTTLEMIPFLAERKDLTVITNAASAADRLGELGIRTYCTGGLLTPSSQAYTGRFAEEMIRSFHADAMFFSSAGISPEGEITDYSDEETRLRRVMLLQAARRYFLFDTSKFGKVFCYSVCSVAQLSGVFSNGAIPEEWDGLFRT